MFPKFKLPFGKKTAEEKPTKEELNAMREASYSIRLMTLFTAIHEYAPAWLYRNTHLVVELENFVLFQGKALEEDPTYDTNHVPVEIRERYGKYVLSETPVTDYFKDFAMLFKVMDLPEDLLLVLSEKDEMLKNASPLIFVTICVNEWEMNGV